MAVKEEICNAKTFAAICEEGTDFKQTVLRVEDACTCLRIVSNDKFCYG
jgi:hypothetical protein